MNFLWFFRARKNATNAHHQAINAARFGQLAAMVWIVFGVLVIFGVWAHWATLDQITRAPGAVIASSRTQIIQSQEGGTINDLLVKEGDTVEAGEILLKFERTRFETSFLEARAKAAGLLATVARLQAEVLGTPLAFPQELAQYPEFKKSQAMLFSKRQAAISEEITALDSMITLVQQELQMNLFPAVDVA
ncbi:biotin/lipoyl-binding protein [Limnohabitans sp.]|jgi:adhesin transport system membrane fusion protein|uniref:biotin/lipoyl-containing protein n=1 Tax=Limnohabitans sp. TaxID=1907725 RepID=UPI0037BF7781